MKKVVLLLVAFAMYNQLLNGQESKTPNIVLITLDGFRWQELFSGADPLLIANKEYVHDTLGLKSKYWKDEPRVRREVLLPFIWGNVAKMGQIHGNRNLGSNVDLTNTMWFSYPGYNEILTGRADDTRINSNDKIDNPNITILEIANHTPKYKGKIGAFGSWDVFPFIINEKRSGVPVNAGFETAKDSDLTQIEIFLNRLQPQVPSPWESVRLDAFTHNYALEFMKRKHPNLVYIAYGETDDFAHDGDYGAYLNSAHTTDGLIKELWDFCQEDGYYKDNTIFIISTDHGRGTQPLKTWKGHGSDINGANEVWLITFGAGIKAMGEVDLKEQLYSDQIAPTVLKLLGIGFDSKIIKGENLKVIWE